MASPRPQELVERALRLATCDGCVAVAAHVTTANLRWASNTLTSNGVTRALRLTVVALVDGARGSSVGVISRDGAGGADVEEVVRRAEAVARAGIPTSDGEPLVRGGPASGAWEEAVPGTSIRAFEPFVPELAEATARMRAERRLLAGYAVHTAETTFLASSTGLRLRHDDARGSIELTAAAADRSCSAWVAASTRDFSDVAVGDLAAQLRQRLSWSRRQVELPAAGYETLLPPAAVSDLMIYLYASAGAREALDGRTAFSDGRGGTRVGARVSATPVTLRSDPAEPRLSCRDFVVSCDSSETTSVFDNGLPLQPTSWISDGTLSALVQTRRSAATSGLPVTPWIDNLILEGPPGGRTLDAMVAATDDGLLLTCLWYLREVDPRRLVLTGVTRDGTFLVRGGEVVAAVNNFRFNESPVELLGRIGEVGRTEETIGREWGQIARTAMPPLRVEAFHMSSVSEAV